MHFVREKKQIQQNKEEEEQYSHKIIHEWLTIWAAYGCFPQMQLLPQH